MRVFAIDPGSRESAYCVIDAQNLKPLEFAKVANAELRGIIRERKFNDADCAVIENLQSYGNLIGRDVLDTARWIGIFYECLCRKSLCAVELIYRMEVKMHICRDSRASDANIRRALIDRFCAHDYRNGKGTKKNPDWFCGFAADMWQAYALAVTCVERGGG